MNVLIVDDDFFLLSGLRKTLQRDHVVRVASDGETAASIASSFKPDVVLIDLLLNVDNGLDVIECLRQILPHAMVVCMSSWPGEEIIHEAYASGADAFVGKEEIALVCVLLDRLTQLKRSETAS